MKLNLHIIWDELQDCGGELVGSDDVRPTLSGVRLAEPAGEPLSDRFLYLADAETFARLPSQKEPLSLVCLGVSDRAVIESRGWSAILLPDSGIHPAFRRLQEIFEKYAGWEQEMLLAIANNEPLQSIFDRGARFLRNPIAMFDISLAFIMMAGALPADIENTIWEEVLTKGYTSVENLTAEEQRFMAKALSNRGEPFFYQAQGKYSQHQQLITSLTRDGAPFATFGMIDIVAPFTLGQLFIVSCLKNFMELAFQNNSQLLSITQGTSYFIDRLLQGFSVDQSAVSYHIAKNKWAVEDDFCLLFFARPEDAQIDGSLKDMYAFRIRSLLGDAMVFPYENGVLAISHRDNRIRASRDFSGEFSLLLEKLGLFCGVSLVFQDFMNLKYAYIQCKTALAARPAGPEQRIYLFETQYSDHILKALEVSTSLKSLCHPQILRLSSSEAGKGREFVQSLQTYLINGRNITATAKRLFIHRNTLLYRLGRIEEMLGMDLETVDEQTLFMLYLSCLITQYIR